MGAAVGIDLGTSNTVVACVRDGRAVTLPDEEGNRLIPSVVSFHPNGSVLVGQTAKDRRLIDPANTVYSVKRLIGRSWASEEVQQARGRFPFELQEGTKNSTLVLARGQSYALAEMSAFVLRRAKAVAERALGETVDRAVVTVPANFNDLQRASTKVAGKLAGLEVLRILNEPTAAALAYGQTTTQNERLAVYDLGGGTFDITLLDLSGNVFEVLATAGDTALGGDDIDLVIADIMANEIVRTHRFDPRVDVTEFARLRIYAERLKMKLSSEPEATVEIRDLGMGEGGKPVTIAFKMTRAELEQEAGSMIDRTLEVSRFAIETVNLKTADIDRVILVGGPTRMPLVQRRAEAFFGKAPALKVNPDEVVALGAAIQAHVLDRGRKGKATTKAPPPMPNARPDAGAVPRISARAKEASPSAAPPIVAPRNPPAIERTPREAIAASELSLPRTAPLLTFDPPITEAARQGSPMPPMRPPMRTLMQPFGLPAAAPPASPIPELAPLPPRMATPLLIDVTPLSLRVETVGGFCDALIGANTAVPCDRTRTFLTAADGQTTVVVRVAQGESNRFAENTYLGELELSGIAAAPRGETQIAVTFEIDADGILNVKARDGKSGRQTQARLQLLGAQTEPKDVEAMMQRQAQHAVI